MIEYRKKLSDRSLNASQKSRLDSLGFAWGRIDYYADYRSSYPTEASSSKILTVLDDGIGDQELVDDFSNKLKKDKSRMMSNEEMEEEAAVEEDDDDNDNNVDENDEVLGEDDDDEEEEDTTSSSSIFEDKDRDKRGFEQIYRSLVAFKDTYGHVSVPARW